MLNHLGLRVEKGKILRVFAQDLRKDLILQNHMQEGSLLLVGQDMNRRNPSLEYNASPALVHGRRGGPSGTRLVVPEATPEPTQDKVVEVLSALLEEVRGLREEIRTIQVRTVPVSAPSEPARSSPVVSSRQEDDTPMFIPSGLVREGSTVKVESTQGESSGLDSSIERLREMKRKNNG